MLLRVCESLYTFACIEYHKSATQKCSVVVPKVEAVEYIQDTSVHVSACKVSTIYHVKVARIQFRDVQISTASSTVYTFKHFAPLVKEYQYRLTAQISFKNE